MRIGIDASLLEGAKDGTQLYLRNLIRTLPAASPNDSYTLFVPPSLDTTLIPGAEHMRKAVVARRIKRLRLPFAFSAAMVRMPVDVVHVQFAAPLYCPARIVVTIHDIQFERYPQFYDPKALRQLRVRVPLTVRRAAVILTVSEFSKQDIARRYRVDPERIIVAPDAADLMFQPIPDRGRLADIRARYATGDHFILATGSLKPNKNPKTLLEAYSRLRRAGVVQHRLILVGARVPWLSDDTFAAVRNSPYEQDVVFTGYVPDDDLVALYNAADVFVHPSLFDGFGLPPLEAMACGTPVVTSNVTALPEVVDDAALTVDPLDVEALASAMARVLTDPGLRARLSAQGLQRASTFSWEATARIVAGAYQRAALDPRQRSRAT